ncbi:5559_t:CDS:1, partial [Funneliformis geosporum]
PMTAFEHGAVVFDVYTNFYDLYKLLNPTISLDKGTYNFVRSIFKYFYKYKDDDKTLRKFSHEDPA